jgi:hypothetical protein
MRCLLYPGMRWAIYLAVFCFNCAFGTLLTLPKEIFQEISSYAVGFKNIADVAQFRLVSKEVKSETDEHLNKWLKHASPLNIESLVPKGSRILLAKLVISQIPRRLDLDILLTLLINQQTPAMNLLLQCPKLITEYRRSKKEPYFTRFIAPLLCRNIDGDEKQQELALRLSGYFYIEGLIAFLLSFKTLATAHRLALERFSRYNTKKYSEATWIDNDLLSLLFLIAQLFGK